MRLMRDQDGGPLVEAAIMIPIMFVFLLGSVDWLMAFYQWNAAAKAVQVGARIAAVSDPVAGGLIQLSTNATVTSTTGAMPAFTVICDGGTSACTCSGTCAGVSGYSATAMNNIVFGRGRSSCGASTSSYNIGMCNMLSTIAVTNVTVTYQQTGLGYAGRPGGPMPTIVIALQNLRYNTFFLGGVFGLRSIRMPPMTTTITAEDLSSSAPS